DARHVLAGADPRSLTRASDRALRAPLARSPRAGAQRGEHGSRCWPGGARGQRPLARQASFPPVGGGVPPRVGSPRAPLSPRPARVLRDLTGFFEPNGTLSPCNYNKEGHAPKAGGLGVGGSNPLAPTMPGGAWSVRVDPPMLRREPLGLAPPDESTRP